MCFGRGPSNHQGRWGEGGDPGVKSKGGGHSLWGFVHGFLGLPAKKTRRWPAGNGSLYVRDSASPEGELSVLWSGPLEPSRKMGGSDSISFFENFRRASCVRTHPRSPAGIKKDRPRRFATLPHSHNAGSVPSLCQPALRFYTATRLQVAISQQKLLQS